MNSKKYIVGFFLSAIALIGAAALTVYHVDPYIHYHKPHTESYFYTLGLENQRNVNYGICRHLDYDALITGTSMIENFNTTEFDEIFGVNSIKVPFAGGTYKEINDCLKVALKSNPELKTVVRGLDIVFFLYDADAMRTDLGEYPLYLYDDNPFNDVEYLFNKEILFHTVYPMIEESKGEVFTPGMTSFTDYNRWQDLHSYGKNTVCPEGLGHVVPVVEEEPLSESTKKMIYDNVTQNITSLTDSYPDVDFYYFFTPYSIAWWSGSVGSGSFSDWLNAEQYIIELMLEHENIKLFSFSTRADILADLNNFQDNMHYAEWVNSLMLKWMHEGKYRLTVDNYLDYLEDECEYYINFDYDSIAEQEDYESDYYAAALLNEELTGASPVTLSEPETLEAKPGCEISIGLDDIGGHRYLCFSGSGCCAGAAPSVRVYDAQGELVSELTVDLEKLDGEKHQFVLNLPKLDGAVTVVFSGGTLDNTVDTENTYIFSDIMLY